MKRILASASPGEVRVAVVQDDELVDYLVWRPGAPDRVGDCYRGRVIARVRAMAGAFIALGDGLEGFLPDSEGAAGLGDGDRVLVRVTRASQGGKGPRLSARDCSGSTDGGSGLIARGPGALLELAVLYGEAPVVVDDRAWLARLRPLLGERLSFDSEAFDREMEAELAVLGETEVTLPGGARLAIHPTPALIAIDVDAGRGVGMHESAGAGHRAVNLSVLPALARQIRLRNLSGAILVDFAGMAARRRVALGPALAEALADDPLRPKLLGFTSLGLAEIVRTRMHPPLHEVLAGPHAAGLEALREVARQLDTPPFRLPRLRASPAVIAALEADAEALPDLARRAGRSLILQADPGLPATGWVIEEDNG